MRNIWAVLAILSISGCALVEDTTLVRLPDIRPDITRNISAKNVQIRTVSLPAYAASEDIIIETSAGTLTELPGVAWADLPERAVTLALARDLRRITGAVIGPDPWPLDGLADRVIDLRVQEMVARTDGTFVIMGQYFISGEPARARIFEMSAPVLGQAPSDIARAKAVALTRLAESLASDL